MGGFTIKCNICGKEIVVTQQDGVNVSSNPIAIYGGYDGEIFVQCDCGNEIND